MNGGFFVTGTDTDVGKTLVTAALLSRLLDKGWDVIPMKPVQTGCPSHPENNKLGSPDIDVCLQLTGLTVKAAESELITPYKFRPACSPHLASEQACIAIDLDRICNTAAELLQKHEALLVEGAGGVLVPINSTKTMLDLMVQLALPVVIAARPGLGTLNHTLLTINELRRANLKIAGVVFCETRPTTWGMIEKDNWQTIERLGKVSVLGYVPYFPALAKGDLMPTDFAAILRKTLPL